MAGIDAISGRVLDEIADIRHSIADIVKTPVGTRVMRRTYGSHVFDVIDAPGNEIGALRAIAAAADGIYRWEKRVRLKSAHLSVTLDGAATLTTTCAVKGSDLTITADTRLTPGAS